MDPVNPVAGNPEALNQVEPAVQKQPSTHLNNITIFSMALFVLLSLGVVAFLYYQNQQLKSMLAKYQTPVPSSTPAAAADPTANWKIYTNAVAGVSFKYPDSVVVDDSTPNKTLNIGLKTRVEQFKSSGGSSGNPYFANIAYNQALKTFNEIPFGSKIVEKTSTTLGGKSATQYLVEITETQEGFNIGDQIVRVIVKDNSSWTGAELQDQTQKSLFNQILSTFKFLGQNSNIYSNSKYSFEFQYPQGASVTESQFHSNGSVLDLNIGNVATLQVTPMSPKDLLSVTIGTLGNQKTSTISVSGISATKITGLGGIGGSVQTTAVYFTKNNLTYLLVFGTENESTNTILSTLKFTN